MKSSIYFRWLFLSLLPFSLAANDEAAKSSSSSRTNLTGHVAGGRLLETAACEAVLAPQAKEEKIDREIARLQEQIKAAPDPVPFLDRLGWVFVAKARLAQDPDFYKLAQGCADCIAARQPGSFEAMLLRGHILHQNHSFKEAEPLARTLAEKRGAPFDFGLLGDVLMEQGQLPEAIEAYQTMMDLRPGLEAYSRAAHVRWLKGDLTGAIELMEMAVGAASVRDRESAAWTRSRLAGYQLQAGEIENAAAGVTAALTLLPDHSGALLTQARISVAQGKTDRAIKSLRQAIKINPLPEILWFLADSLALAGQMEEAQDVETLLEKDGLFKDARTFSLYLSTRGKQPVTALHLARRELAARGDVFTHDAIAWALFSSGQVMEAEVEMKLALAEGTCDARLFFHAAAIAAGLHKNAEASRFAAKAEAARHMLLPSERKALKNLPSGLAKPHEIFPITTININTKKK